MDTLDGTEWDVVITDTGFLSSLLALSLSRSGKRILHLDPREYYGGAEAALSLAEATAWASDHREDDASSTFSNVSVIEKTGNQDSKVASSRAYSIALAPHLIYARCNLVSTLVSSKCHNQLDFQAVGSWFIADRDAQAGTSNGSLTRVPSSREDVFQDQTLGLKAKRSLMKFLRFVADYEEQTETWHDSRSRPFSTFLEQKFGLPAASHGPILALLMSGDSPAQISTERALPRIARHLRSIGVFGPGFGAVLPKWGGLAEIAQVACRAGAVGGGVYVLNKSIKTVTKEADSDIVSLELDEDEKITTRWLCGSSDEVARAIGTSVENQRRFDVVSKIIAVISTPLATLFPPTSEGGVPPAGAVVVIPSSSDAEPPVNILVHTSEAGECPMNQSIVYASVALPHDEGFLRLQQAIDTLLLGVSDGPEPHVLWSMQYQQRAPSQPRATVVNGGLISLSELSNDLALDDSALDSVRQAWQIIIGESEDIFMAFEDRGGLEDND